jgi:tetraacyldisaccharide 4'-kinase
MYRDVISGQKPGYITALLRLSLRLLSLPYSLAVRTRNRLYARGWLRVHAASVPVISVGNLTVGGTGKTPLVAWLAQHLQSKGLRVAILTRGYKASGVGPARHPATAGDAHRRADEPAELAAMCPGAPVVINPDRVAGAAKAVRSHGARVLVLDDGFQHRRIARDLDIVTLDATLPFGYGRMLPAGLLREPAGSLTRADAVVMTRCDQVSNDELLRIEGQIRGINNELLICRSIHAPAAVRVADEELDLQELRGKNVFAFCGIGNPRAFLDTLEGLGCTLAGSRSFNDHHNYTDRCLAQVHQQACERKADLLLTTQKDWTKIAHLDRPAREPPLGCLIVRLELVSAAADLTALIERALGGRMLGLQRFGKQEAPRSEN